MFRRMIDVIICKRSYSEIAMIMIRLIPYFYFSVDITPRLLYCSSEVLWKELALLVEVIGCALGGSVSIWIAVKRGVKGLVRYRRGCPDCLDTSSRARLRHVLSTDLFGPRQNSR